MIPRRGVKIKFFLSVVIYVVKTTFAPFSAIGGNPANAGITRLCGVSPYSASDTATALPKQARYQLRYTRLLSFYPAGRILPNVARYQLRYTRSILPWGTPPVYRIPGAISRHFIASRIMGPA